MNKEELNKSIDAMIDELFAEDSKGSVEKSIDISKDAKTTADAVTKQAPDSQDDEKRNAGRPKQISDVPKNDQDGKREKKYDDEITENEGKEMEPEETKQVKTSDQTKGGKAQESKPKIYKSEEAPENVDEKEWEEFQAFKKAKAEEAEQEKLQKAKQEQSDLIKSAVMEATEAIRKENEELRKSLGDTQELVKAMAERPQRRKSVSNIQAVEKSSNAGAASEESGEAFSKSEMLDAAEELALNKSLHEFKVDHVTELEQTGYIYDEQARKILEDHLKKKN